MVLKFILFFITYLNANVYDLARDYAKFYKSFLPYKSFDNFILNDLLNVGNILQYKYAIIDNKKLHISSLKLKDKENLKLKLIENAKSLCQNIEVKKMILNGLVLEHIFYLENGGIFFDFKIETCS